MNTCYRQQFCIRTIVLVGVLLLLGCIQPPNSAKANNVEPAFQSATGRCHRLAAAWLDNQPGIDFKKIDPATAVPACEQAVRDNPDNADLKAYLCRALLKAERLQDALLQCQQAAKAGSTAGMTTFGWMYKDGLGVPKDEAQAVMWFRKAAEQGNANAQDILGWMYKDGLGVPKDEAQAVMWFRKAAEQGLADAQEMLGTMYANGLGVAKDEVEAVKWRRKAAEQGDAIGQFNLGAMYAHGLGVTKDESQAVVWFRKAAEQGYAAAQYGLGVMYANGQGIAKDETQAVAWFRKAAEQGYADAQNKLSVHAEGRGVDKDGGQLEQALALARQRGDRSEEGKIIAELGFVYARLGQFPKAQEYLEQALVLARQRGDRSGEGWALSTLGFAYVSSNQPAKAQDYYQQAQAIHREIGDQRAEGSDLHDLGSVYERLGQYSKALEYHQQALAVYQKIGDQRAEGSNLNDLSVVYEKLGQYSKALEYHQQALTIWRNRNDQAEETKSLHAIGVNYMQLAQPTKAQEYLQQALVLARQQGDQAIEGWTLRTLGFVYFGSNQPAKAQEYYQQALAVYQKIGDQRAEGSNLNDLSAVYEKLGQYSKALEYHQQALTIWRNRNDQAEETKSLHAIGVNYMQLAQPTKAQEYLQQALVLARQRGDQSEEGSIITKLGLSYLVISQFGKAQEYLEQALVLARQHGDQSEEGEISSALGYAYIGLGQQAKAQEHLEQALVLARQRGNRSEETSTLIFLGINYKMFGKYAQAIDYLEQARRIAHELGDWGNEGMAFYAIAVIYGLLGQPVKAEEYLAKGKQLIAIAQERGEINKEWFNTLTVFLELTPINSQQNQVIAQDMDSSLSEIINQYSSILRTDDISNEREQQQAVDALNQLLKGANEHGKVIALIGLGVISAEQGQMVKTREYLEQALPAAMETGNPEYIWMAWFAFMRVLAAESHTDAAIFAGKQAVNTLQTMRHALQPLDQSLRKSFLKDRKMVYRLLADLLISQGRLPEAEQILTMLKEEEYFDFLRRAPNTATNLDYATTFATPAEQKFYDAHFSPVSKKITALGLEYGELIKKAELSPAEKERLQQLKTELESRRQAFQAVLTELEAYFDQAGVQESKRFAKLQLDDSDNLQTVLQNLGPGTVALYTLVTDNTLHLLLLTPHDQIARRSVIVRDDLHRSISELRQALQDPNLDPRPKAEELYRLLIAPIAVDLDQAQAKTLMVSLDGILRYIPFAALYDGQKYLSERYALAVFTPLTRTNLKDPPLTAWRIAALGTSKPYPGFSALPAVPAELAGIVRQGTPITMGGVIDGQIYLDNNFSEQNFNEVVRTHYPLIHLATHFAFKSNDLDSFLLLGDGQHLPLTKLNQGPPPFGDVDLITLSACNTALDTTANGKEIEGIGTLMQKRGAKGVIATLWNVADASTSLFMQRFYQLRAEGKLSKAEALRQTQIEFIHQSPALQPGLNALKARGLEVRGFTPDHSTTNSASSVSYPGYTHPYFWAPFILMGNWR